MFSSLCKVLCIVSVCARARVASIWDLHSMRQAGYMTPSLFGYQIWELGASLEDPVGFFPVILVRLLGGRVAG